MTRPRIDMRSDTVTRPTEAMLQAMMAAEVGDDVFGDDPTVNLLQEVMAERLGKEAALYVPSGTMGNQLALKAQTSPGDQILLEDGAHIYRYEGGAPAALCGLLVTCLDAPRGWLEWDQVEQALNPDNVHCAPPRLICLENTHNSQGGTILPPSLFQASRVFADKYNLKIHLDGARIFNAAVALGVTAADLAGPADSISFCLSKGLCAPIGSVLCGSDKFIAKARRSRKQLGAGMRQVGIIAAAGIIALEENVERLADDHRRLRLLAEGLSTVHGLKLQ